MTMNRVIVVAFGGLLVVSACGGGGSGGTARPTVLPPLPPQGIQHARQAPIVDLDGTLHIGSDVAAPASVLHEGLRHRGISTSFGYLLIHEAQQGCRDATYEPSRFPVAVPYPSPHRATPAYVVVTSSDLDTSRNKASVSGLSWISRFGYVTDGVGRETVTSYLQEDAGQNTNSSFPDGFLARFGATPPIVRVAVGTSPELISEAVRAIQLINAALPGDWQLRFSALPAPAETDRPPDGEIHVEFAAREDWPSRITQEGNYGMAVGRATSWYSDAIRTNDPENPWTFVRVAGKAWIDHTRLTGTDRMETVVHEILHTLGRRHPDPARFQDTIMRIMDADGRKTGAVGVPGHVLHPLDREALLAVYGWLDPGDTPANIAEDLGPWASTSYHIRGDIEAVDGAAFGVAFRNGLSQPWASGPTPWTNLADNSALSGTASWEGAMIGFDLHTGSHVGSDADLEIDLGSLAGALDFTSMEAWATGDVVAIGTGTMWGDGDLAYTVRVRGNTFIQTGGDQGVVTGAFFGARHEGMGGTLLRDDLKAAFGGSR